MMTSDSLVRRVMRARFSSVGSVQFSSVRFGWFHSVRLISVHFGWVRVRFGSVYGVMDQICKLMPFGRFKMVGRIRIRIGSSPVLVDQDHGRLTS